MHILQYHSLLRFSPQQAIITQQIEKVPIEIDVDVQGFREIIEVPVEKIVEVPYPVEQICQVCGSISPASRDLFP